MSNTDPTLFKDVCFYIHDTIHPRVRLALHELLVDSGAQPCPNPKNGSESATRRFDLSQLTHFVTDTLDFPEYSLLSEHNRDRDEQQSAISDKKGKGKDKGVTGAVQGEDKPGDGRFKIVLPAWVTRSFDLQALQQSRFYSPDPSLFLAGTCICTSGLPIADDLTICSAVEAFGGQWRRELTREVTHLICVSETGKKYEMAIKFGTELGIAIVLPHWFEESLKLNQLVPMDIYRFPSPPYSTSLRDLSSSKPFVERLTDYWKQRLPPAASTSAHKTDMVDDNKRHGRDRSASSTDNAASSTVKVVPTTATHTILGLEEGLARSTSDKLADCERYFRASQVEGYPSQVLQRELNESNLGLGKGKNASGSGEGASVSQASSSRLHSTLSAVDTVSTADKEGTGVSTWSNHDRRRGGGGGTNRIFEGKKFYLASDLGLSGGIERAIETKIESFGGTAWSFGIDGEKELEAQQETGRAGSVSTQGGARSQSGRDSWARRRIAEQRLREADYVVLRNREGWEYWLAYELDLSIGTPPWLFYTFANQTASSPLARLVHYPPPSRDGVPEFRDKTITVSNYTGLAREYVRTLIELLGAKYEGTMGKTTDFVVTASDYGSKCVHAKSWSIPLVTHLWLESCVISWSLLSPALSPAYTISASAIEGTMFPTILGWKSWSKEAIRRWADSEEKREEREKGRRGVEELERDERDGDDQDEGEEREEEQPRDGMQIEEEQTYTTRDLEDQEQKMEVDDHDEAKDNNPDVPEAEAVEEGQEEKISERKAKEVAVADVPPLREAKPSSKTSSKKKQVEKGPTDTKVNSRADAVDMARNEEAPARSRSKSANATSPRPVPRDNKTPDRPVKSTKSTKPVAVKEQDDNDSSALTDDDDAGDKDEDDEGSSSSESSLPPSAKAISKHFNKIDAHNLVQPGSKRAAAGKARAALHIAMEDKNQFDQEQKSSAKKGAAATTRRRSGAGRESGTPTKKRKRVKTEVATDDEADEEQADEEEAEEEDSKPVIKKGRGRAKRASTVDDGETAAPKKKAKAVHKNLKNAKEENGATQEGAVSSFDNPPRAKPPSAKSSRVRVLTTGANLLKTSPEIKDLKALGAVWTEKAQEATHVVVKNITRTEKFLTCLCYAPIFVTKKWIDASIDAGELVDETPYLLKDKAKEAELGDTLTAILARAEKKKALHDRKVYISKKAHTDIGILMRIVSACGGIVAPSDLIKHHKKIVADPEALVVSGADDRREWDKLASEGIPIYTAEAIFTTALLQSAERGFTDDNRVDAQLSS